MSDIKTKRASLEAYLREQVIGPGAGRNRIVRTNKDTEFYYLNQPYFDNREEALTVVPGVYYSSGILFPNKDKKNGKNETPKNGVDQSDDQTAVEIDEDTDDINTLEERNLSEDDDGVQMDQMFPKTMGLTFCMKADNLKKEGFEKMLEKLKEASK